MSKEYYQILNLPRNCSDIQIKRAYRELGVTWHPEKNAHNKEAAELKFRDLAEAYEVLSDAHKRAIFDQFGENGLKQGVPDGKGGFTGSWKFSGDAHAIFQKFFGADNPFSDVFSDYGSFGSAQPFNPNLREPKKMPNFTHTVFCSLEEFYTGCSKKITITRRRFAADGQLRTEEKTLTVDVKPGYKSGTKITFPGEGDEEAGIAAGDAVFTLEQQPHPRFVRNGLDLEYACQVSLADALTGATVQLTTLDGRQLSIPISEIVHPGYVMVVQGEGMPSTKAGVANGDLKLRLSVVFPHELSIAQKKELKQVLAGAH